MRKLGVLMLLVSLAGCGASEYEKAKALLAASQSEKSIAEKELAEFRDGLDKFPKSDWDPSWQEAIDMWESTIEQADQNIREAQSRLKELAR